MKKLFLYIIIIAAAALSGCQKKSVDLVQGQTVDDRLSAALTQYRNILTKAPYGWKLVETSGVAYNNGAYDSAKAIFVYYMQFNDSNTVTQYGSFDTVQAKVPKRSGYRISSLQRPTLIFDTYGYIHVPCDPDPSVSKSPLDPGMGWGTDYEFMFVDNMLPDQLGDTIHLTGLKNSATAYLVKATKDEKTIMESGQYASNINLTALKAKLLTYWQRFTIGATLYELPAIDFFNKALAFNWLDGSGNQQTFRTTFWIDFNGNIVFVTPFVSGNVTVTGITPNAGLIGVNVPTITLTPSIVPLKLDVSAAQNWYNQMSLNFNGCWVTDKAFHLNGVDDYCQFGNVTSAGATAVTKGAAQLWYGGAGVFGAANPYDGFITFINSASLSSAAYFVNDRPLVINGGIATFAYYGAAGTFTGAAGTLSYSMNLARSIVFYAVSGTRSVGNWYLIPTSSSGKNYDMVRVSDALAWISWRPR
ncbi:MAG: DUF4302 domain-containing protein [Filimonas sp.]|nr:DUF4302 domain-containing protein [Filimonas sp.]